MSVGRCGASWRVELGRWYHCRSLGSCCSLEGGNLRLKGGNLSARRKQLSRLGGHNLSGGLGILRILGLLNVALGTVVLGRRLHGHDCGHGACGRSLLVLPS